LSSDFGFCAARTPFCAAVLDFGFGEGVGVGVVSVESQLLILLGINPTDKFTFLYYQGVIGHLRILEAIALFIV
jgi:hypothetical protein